jgi:hypothetical protein
MAPCGFTVIDAAACQPDDRGSARPHGDTTMKLLEHCRRGLAGLAAAGAACAAAAAG